MHVNWFTVGVCLVTFILQQEVCLAANWSLWTAWTLCSRTCGPSGQEIRYRTCVVSTSHLGCPGTPQEFRACFKQACPIGNWAPWTLWSGCSQTCGPAAVQQRIRGCIGPGDCIGLDDENRPCIVGVCQFGSWSLWTPWSACDRTCGVDGNRRRTRVCIVGPTGTRQGCVGPDSLDNPCSRMICPITYVHEPTVQRGQQFFFYPRGYGISSYQSGRG